MRAPPKETPVLLDASLLDFADQGAHEFAQMGGFIGAHSYGVDPREVISGSEGRLHAGEPVAVPEKDAWVDPGPHRGTGAAPEGAHPPHFAVAQVPHLREGIRGVERSGSDQQAGTDHEE